MIPIIPGAAGAIALAIAPQPELRLYFWLPLVLDVGCGPYLVLAAVVALREALTSRAWLRHIPFVRYFVKDATPPRAPLPKERAIIGCILGTAVGDALGLVCEGLRPGRQRAMYPEITGYRFLFGKGMCSDDTEHTLMLAQSLIETGNFHREALERKFVSNFAWRLRFWLLGLPAGIGMATLRAILKLWIGFPGTKSGVFSAGNAPAMRAALLGVCYGDDPGKMHALVRAATRITHTDPKAEHGALAVALAAHLTSSSSGRVDPHRFRAALGEMLGGEAAEFRGIVDGVAASLAGGENAASYARRIGCGGGVTGYVYHTVPVALHVWLVHQDDYRQAVTTVIRLGGDTDTTAAIVGAIVGARIGKEGIPREWLRNLWEWPRTAAWMEQVGVKLADCCAHGTVSAAVPVSALKLLARNAFFMIAVLIHGFRRLLVLPPY
ncbi:MAG: ADP-ribosylglycohydrolase family protein [Betaproteobacteria bacterium]|nr:ADP-ribosylglycohydrolase family protein [Betaproteobacteria bacterium]